MAQSIVVGYDGSACSRDALAAAVDLAAGATDGEVIVVYCHEIPAGLSCELDPACAAAKELRDFERHIEQDIEPMLEEAAGYAREAGVRAETEVAWDDLVAALPRVAMKRGARVIVVGSHSEGAVSGMLRRSPCYRLVHSSPLPVLIVPHHKEALAASV
jgi:nucleotide-binding universal stress UspA family protein